MPHCSTVVCEETSRPDTKDMVLDAALSLFTTKGYFKTSVRDIRKNADVSIGSIYHYFKNKESIAKALYDSLVNRMGQAIDEIRAKHDTTHDRCRAIVECFFNMTDTKPAMMKYVLYARHREFMPDEKPICSSRPFEAMKKIVEEGIECGEIRRMQPVVAATSLFGGAIRMVHLLLDGVVEGPLSDHLDEIWECAWNGVKEVSLDASEG